MTAFWTLFQREIARFLKVIVQTVITPFISSFLYLLIFGVSLGAKMPSHEGVPYLAFLIPGLMMMGLMNNAFQNSSSSIVSSKFSGDLEDLRVSPLSNQEIIWAMGLAALVRGFVVSVITFIVGSVFCYYQIGEILSLAHPIYVFYFIVMGGMIFGLLGISVAFWATSFDQLSAFSAFILLPLTYLGGVFLSIENLHPIWQFISKLNPLLYLINGLRYGVVGVSDVPMTIAVPISLAGFVVFYGMALFSLKKGSFQRW
ncbi:ABC transporter permease [Bdellovibrio sp. NC01]|uniref:ABC transporter permease n=1 Tax=Bdellovibrio sp. NC01 TaxID=2220073 RepID=UPI00115956BB|nr:ABC transporter permease [Bdellovibrio sp. NC01]QDK37897.1 ABC transporter permease [Bdellovibrio sp. NC01]